MFGKKILIKHGVRRGCLAKVNPKRQESGLNLNLQENKATNDQTPNTQEIRERKRKDGSILNPTSDTKFY